MKLDADAWRLARLNWQRGMVAMLARDNAEDLEPEQMKDQALQLIQKSIELRTGQPVEFDALDIQLTRPISEDEPNEAVKQEFSLYAERFYEFAPPPHETGVGRFIGQAAASAPPQAAHTFLRARWSKVRTTMLF